MSPKKFPCTATLASSVVVHLHSTYTSIPLFSSNVVQVISISKERIHSIAFPDEILACKKKEFEYIMFTTLYTPSKKLPSSYEQILAILFPSRKIQFGFFEILLVQLFVVKMWTLFFSYNFLNTYDHQKLTCFAMDVPFLNVIDEAMQCTRRSKKGRSQI